MLTAPIIFYCLPSYHQNNKYLVRPNTCYEYDSAFPLNKFFSAQIKEAFRCTSEEDCFSDNNPQQTLPDLLTELYVVIFIGSVRKTTTVQIQKPHQLDWRGSFRNYPLLKLICSLHSTCPCASVPGCVNSSTYIHMEPQQQFQHKTQLMLRNREGKNDADFFFLIKVNKKLTRNRNKVGIREIDLKTSH